MEGIGDNHHHLSLSENDWKFLNRPFQRPGGSSDIDFVKWNKAQTPVIKRVISLEITAIIQIACPEVRNLLHGDSTETGIVFVLGRMFAQCFYQYGIEGVLDESDYKHLSHEQKLWASNVVLGTEDCHDPFILEVVYFVKEKLNNYLLNNAEDLMKKAATKVEENFLGGKGQ